MKGSYKVTTADGDSFYLTESMVKLSSMMATCFNLDEEVRWTVEEDDDGISEVSLPNVNSKEMKHIINLLDKYSKNPFGEIKKPLISTLLTENGVSQWFAEYMDKLSIDELSELALAFNYLDVSPLLNLSCAAISARIKGRSPEEVNELFEDRFFKLMSYIPVPDDTVFSDFNNFKEYYSNTDLREANLRHIFNKYSKEDIVSRIS